VPSGRHEVVWRYEPVSVKWGALLSGVAILAWITAAMVVRRLDRTKPAA
jgi:hypothetical protein